MILCHRRVTRWYRLYNERWFNDDLPHDVDVYWIPTNKCAADLNVLFNDPESYILQLNPAFALDMNIARIALLHEMAHIKLWPYKKHGPSFDEEIQRLATIGAYKGLL